MRVVLLMFLSVLVFSCSHDKGNTSGFPHDSMSEDAKTVADALEKIGINSPEKVYESFTSIKELNRLLELLQKEDPEIDSGLLVHFLKEIEIRDVLGKKEVKSELIDNMVITGLSLGRFKAQTAPVATDSIKVFSRNIYLSKTTKTADELKKADQFETLNNLFSEFSLDRLTLEDFDSIRETLSSVSERIPSQVLEGSNQKSAEGRTDPDMPLPYEREDLPTEDSPSTDAMQWAGNKFNSCMVTNQQFPMNISGDESAPFAVNDSTDTTKRMFSINKNGLALLTVTADSTGGEFILNNPAGEKINSAELTANEKKFFVLPVFRNDICAPFSFKLNTHISVDITSLTTLVNIDSYITDDGLEINNLMLAESSSFGEVPPVAYFSFFHAADETGAIQNTYFSADSSNSPYTMMIISPEGKNTAVESGVAGTILSENGLHEILVVPEGTVILDKNSRKIIKAEPVAELTDPAEVSISIKIDMTPDQTKKFVLGILKTAAFSRDGEPDSEKRAEMKINLHTNMAPRMTLGTKKLDEYFGSSGGTYYAWKCWVDNGKPVSVAEIETIFTDASGACAEHESGYEAILDKCADQLFLTPPLCLPWFGLEVKKYYEDAVYQEIAENYEEAYQNWKNKIVQINSMAYPYGNLYNISDSEGFDIHPVIPVDMPVFGVEKERLKDETAPLSFDYSAIERDKLDEDAMLFSAAEWIVNTAVAIATGDLYRLVCGSVGFLNDARSLERAAADDSIGNANFRLNRASKKHLFYGLEDGFEHFSFSGPADAPAQYSSFDKGVMYADLACDIQQSDNMLDAYYVYEDVRKIIDVETYDYQAILDSMLENPALSQTQKNAITALFEMIKAGNLPNNYEAQLLAKDILGMFPEGSQDVFSDIDSLNEGLKNIGGLGSMGKNLMASQAYYYFNGYSHRKTLGAAAVGVVRSLPVTDLKVNLMKTIIHNPMEETIAGVTSRAEFRINSRVGTVGDGTPEYRGISIKNAQSYNTGSGHLYTNGSTNPTIKGTPFRAYTKRKISNNTTVGDTDSESFELSAPDDTTLFDASFNDNSNMAAIYVEIGVYENDGDNIDDDMVGVYSRTFLLEDFFSNDTEHKWTSLGGNKYRLEVMGAYLYGAHQLATTVELTGNNKEKQMEHNTARLEKKNAEISFTIDIELGTITAHPDFSFPLPGLEEDTSFDVSMLHPQIVQTAAAFEEELLILDQINNKVLVAEKRSSFSTDPSTTRVFVFEFDDNSMTLTQTHELSGVLFPALAEAFKNRNFLGAKFAKDGEMVVMLEKYQQKADTGRLFSFDITTLEAELISTFKAVATANPVKLAVDADGSTVYAGTDDAERDIIVLSLSDSGTFSPLFDESGVPFTVIHIEPLEEGYSLVLSKKSSSDDIHFTIFKKENNSLNVVSTLRFSEMSFRHSSPYPYRAHKNKFVIGSGAIEWDSTYFLQDPETAPNIAKGIRHPELPFYCTTEYMNQFYKSFGFWNNDFFCWLGTEAVKIEGENYINSFRYISDNPRFSAAVTLDNELVLIDLFGDESCEPADAGNDIEWSLTTSVTLNAVLPAGLTGKWEIISGEGGTVSDKFDPESGFSGARGEIYTLKWIVSDPVCGDQSDEISVSIANGEPCEGNETVIHSGKTYNTVKIGNQCWFRENLDAGILHLTQTDNGIVEKKCPEDGCEEFGGLYEYYELVNYNIAGSGGNLDDPQGICPDGWHVPTSNEWLALINKYGGLLNAGTALVQGGESGLEIRLFNNTNSAGTKYIGASYWSSTSYGSSSEAFPFTFYESTEIGDDEEEKTNLKSARCILDTGSSGCIAISDAGPDQLEVAGTSTTLAANEPLEGSGEWQIISGEGGSFADSTKNNTVFTGTAGTSYVLQWIVSSPENPACEEFITDTVNISFSTGGSFTCGDVLTDGRDSKTYNTILLGGKCWMKESLNIGTKLTIDRDNTIVETAENNTEIEKYCYNNDEAKCTEYGAFYTWNEVMNWVESEGAQGICPAGWHIPSVAEFTALVKLYDVSADDSSSSTAGDDLRNTSLFAAKIGGDFIPSNYNPYSNENYETQFWTSTQYDPTNAYRRMVYASSDMASGGTMAKDKGAYLRCVKN